jgi:nucleoside-diphosphate-sugar epimerase
LSINDWSDFNQLNNIEFRNVIFLIGSSDHEIINNAPTLALEKNFLPIVWFLEYLITRTNRPKKIVTFTTMLQYDSNNLHLPCSENNLRNPYVNKYVFSKYLAEEATSYYRKYFEIIDIRLSNVYGATELKRPDIVPSLIWSLLENENTFVRTKIPKRDFVYVQDVIKAIIELMNTDISCPLNLGSGTPSSISDICNILEDLSGKKITELGEKYTGHKVYYHDLTLLKQYIDYNPLSLADGLNLTYKSMQNYHLNGIRI